MKNKFLKKKYFYFITIKKGFSLIEALCSIAISAIILLSANKFYININKETNIVFRQYYIQQQMNKITFLIEKDLQRAGFCINHLCQGNAIYLSNHYGELPNSCVIIAYDINGNGIWDNSITAQSEYFSYRLKNKRLEIKRGEKSCTGIRWESLFDPAEIVVEEFKINLITKKLIQLSIIISLKKNTLIKLKYENFVYAQNSF